MRRFRKALLLALGLAGGVGVLYGSRYLAENLKGDPLASFRAPQKPEFPDTLGLRLTNVHVRRFIGNRVETQFAVDQLDIERNRNVFAMTGIHDGVYRPEEKKGGETGFRFAASRGSYNGYVSLLNLEQKVKIQGKEYNLASDALKYDGGTHVLTIASTVRGTAWGGKVRAERVTYDIAKKAFTSGPSMWQGKIPEKYLAQMGLPASMQRSEWNVEADTTRSEGDTVVVYANATVSDKEVILKAPQVKLDKRTDTIVGTGGVRYWSGKANFTGDKITILRKEKRAILEGHVHMLVRTKADEAAGPRADDIPPYNALPAELVTAGKDLPTQGSEDRVRSGQSIRDFPLVVVGDRVEYTYAKGSRAAMITGTPQARQELGNGEWRQVWTKSARYDAENQTLRLDGTPGKSDARLKNSIGDDVISDWFELSTAKGSEAWSAGPSRARVIVTDPDLNKNGSTGARGKAKPSSAPPVERSESIPTVTLLWRIRFPLNPLASRSVPASAQASVWNVESNGASKSPTSDELIYQDATVSDAEVILKAPKVTVNRKTNLVVATGDAKTRVRYWSGRANFVADKVTIIRREKRAILEGDVKMLVKKKSEEEAGPKIEEIPPYTPLPPEKVVAGKELPKPTDIDRVRDGKSVRDYPLVVVGAKADYNYAKGSRVAIITGSPQARQELGEGAWRQVWTNTARYDAENEVLRLNGTKGKGDARLKNSIGDDLTANWFELSTGDGDEEWGGEAIRGVVATTDDEDLPKNGKPPAGSTSPPTTGPPPTEPTKSPPPPR